MAGRSFNWNNYDINFSLQDGSVSGPMLFACIVHFARRIGWSRRVDHVMNNTLEEWRLYTTQLLPGPIAYERFPSRAWLNRHILDIVFGFREMNLQIFFFNDKTPECVVKKWPEMVRSAPCLKVDIGCRIKTGGVSVVNFKVLRASDVTAGRVVEPIRTYAQYGEAMRGGVSFDIFLGTPEGPDIRAKVTVYSCMKELWKNTRCKFFSYVDFEPLNTTNGMRERLQTYKDAIWDVMQKGLEFLGEDTRIEVTFKNISIDRAFAIFNHNRVHNIVKRQISMLRFDSKELITQMYKFIEMAEADGRFSGRGTNKPDKMCFIGVIQAQLMMGMIGPINARKYQEYNLNHFNEIYNFGPRRLSMAEQQEEIDNVNLILGVELLTHRNNARQAFLLGMPDPMFMQYVENSTLVEIEALLLDHQTEVLQGERRIAGLPGFWNDNVDDIFMDYARHAFLLKAIGGLDTTLGYPNGLARDILLRDPDVCLLLYCIYKLSAIRTNLRRGRPTTYFVIRMGRGGGHTIHRSSKIEVALDILYSFSENWVDKVRRLSKPDEFWSTYNKKAGRHEESDHVDIFGGNPIALLPDHASDDLWNRFQARFAVGSVMEIRRANNLAVFPHANALPGEDLFHGGINDDRSEDDEA